MRSEDVCRGVLLFSFCQSMIFLHVKLKGPSAHVEAHVASIMFQPNTHTPHKCVCNGASNLCVPYSNIYVRSPNLGIAISAQPALEIYSTGAGSRMQTGESLKANENGSMQKLVPCALPTHCTKTHRPVFRYTREGICNPRTDTLSARDVTHRPGAPLPVRHGRGPL